MVVIAKKVELEIQERILPQLKIPRTAKIKSDCLDSVSRNLENNIYLRKLGKISNSIFNMKEHRMQLW